MKGIWALCSYDSIFLDMTVKGFFKGIGEFFRFLLFTPSWGGKRRAEQQAYEKRLDEAMKSVRE